MFTNGYQTRCGRWAFCASVLIFVNPVFSASIERVKDPYKDAALSCVDKPDGRLRYGSQIPGYAHFRIRADLNFDGREDLILTTEEGPECGTGGCPTAVYLKQADGSYARIKFWLHPLDTSLARRKKGGGALTTYWHISAKEGDLSTYAVTADSIIRIHSDKVYQDEIEKMPDNAAPDIVNLQAEFARCKSGSLGWSSSYE